MTDQKVPAKHWRHRPAGKVMLDGVTTRQLLEEVANRGEALDNADLEYNAQMLIEVMPADVLDSTGHTRR